MAWMDGYITMDGTKNGARRGVTGWDGMGWDGWNEVGQKEV